MQPTTTARLPRPMQRMLHAVGLAVWFSGALWLVFHYFLVKQGEFGPEENPWTAKILAIHGLCAFFAIWLFGWLWHAHLQPGWQKHRRRWSGSALAALLILLTASGYLLYYASGDRLRSVISISHWAMGLALPLPYLLHRLKRRRPRSQLRQPQRQQPDPQNPPQAAPSLLSPGTPVRP